MTTADYISKITEGILTLVKENPTVKDEANLGSDEYFVQMIYVDYESYLRNYVQYKNQYNYNTRYKTYDIDIKKKELDYGYYITKHYKKLNNTNQGRVIIVSTSDYIYCVDIDDETQH